MAPGPISLPPIVYLPGAGGHSSFWSPVAHRLWRRGGPIVLGYPGLGDAPPDPRLRSLSDLHDALLAVLPPRFHLVGQSMGNVIALRTAIEQPDRVVSLVLCAVTGGVDVRSLGAAEWRQSLRPEQALAPTWFIDDTTDFTERLPLVRAPALVLSGNADPLSPVRVGAFLQRHLPSAQLCVVPGGTHSMAHDEPDRIAELIERFLPTSQMPAADTVSLRPARPDDEPFLLAMLFRAAHADDDTDARPEHLLAIRALSRYVVGFGAQGDLGIIAETPEGRPVGAAWLRLLAGSARGYGWVADDIPELAIGILPGHVGRGVGTRLMSELVARAHGRFPALSLSVRRENPARRLYLRLGFVPHAEVVNRIGGLSDTMVLRFA